MVPTPAASVPDNTSLSRPKFSMADFLTVNLTRAGAGTMALCLAFLTGVLVYGAWPAIQKFGFRFITSSDWDPVQDQFGAYPVIMGTLVSAFWSMLIAVPVSVGCAVFLTRLAPKWLVEPASFLIELLASIPSIAYGLWGAMVLVPFLSKTGMPFLKATVGKLPVIGNLFTGASAGFSMLAASLVLAVMVIPIITAVTREVLKAVPPDMDMGARALGATWWQATWIVLQSGKIGILGAVILGFARAIGETMAVTMVIGNSNEFKWSLLNPGQTMASLMANEFREADKQIYIQSLIYVSLILLILTLVLNAIARMFVGRVGAGAAARAKAAANVSEGKLDTSGNKKEKQMGKTAVSVSSGIAFPTSYKIPRHVNKVMVGICIACAMLTLVMLFAIFGYVLYRGFSSLSWDFFTLNPGPVGSPMGMRMNIIGTLKLIGAGSLIGIPLGVLCGVYLAEFSAKSRWAMPIRLVVDVLAGTPSIIIGVLAYQLVVVPLHSFSGWAGAVALGFLMAPIIARTTEEMLNLVPKSYREASSAVGARMYQTLFRVTLPAAKVGIITGIMLAVARIAGETAPLIFTALGSDSNDSYSMDQPFPALTIKIFQYAGSAEKQWIEQAWAGMLVLIMITFVLSLAMRYVVRTKR